MNDIKTLLGAAREFYAAEHDRPANRHGLAAHLVTHIKTPTHKTESWPKAYDKLLECILPFVNGLSREEFIEWAEMYKIIPAFETWLQWHHD